MNQRCMALGILATGCLAGCANGADVGEDPYGGGFEATRQLSIELEMISGVVQGEVLEPEIDTLAAHGELTFGNSAHFVVRSGELALPVTERVPSDEEQPQLTVSVNACPIDLLAGQGRMFGDLADAASLNVCRDGWCRSAHGRSLEIEVIDTLEGRRVLAHTLWEGDDEVTVQLRYTEMTGNSDLD